MVAERSQDPPPTCASVFSPVLVARSTMAEGAANLPEWAQYVRSGVMDMPIRPGTMGTQEVSGSTLASNLTTTVVSSATVFTLFAEGAVIVGKKIFQHWRRYRREEDDLRLRIHPDTPTDSLAELDSPGSRLDGMLAIRDRDRRGPREEEASQQQGQVFLKEFKAQEKKFEENMAKLQNDYTIQLQRIQVGMDTKDQEKNKEIWELRQEVKKYQTRVLEQNKLIEEITEHNSREKTLKKEKNQDDKDQTDIDDFYELDKRSGNGTWKDGYNKLTNKVPNTSPAAASYSMATPRHTIGELVDAWIDDYLQHGGIISEHNIDTNGNIIHNWGKLVRNRLKELGIRDEDNTRKKIDFNQLVSLTSDDNTNVLKTPASKTRREAPSPSTDGSSGGQSVGGLNNLSLRPSGGDDDDPDDSHDSGIQDNKSFSNKRRGLYDDDDGKEFRLVNPRNIVINTFTGKNLAINPYIQLNNQIRKLIVTMGEDGEDLLEILDIVEKFGKRIFTTAHLKELKKKRPKAYQYDRAVNAALLNWTGGIAQGLVRFGTQGGLDAWRKLYNKYIPLAEDMQGILIRQLMSIKPVAESEVDGLFDEVERIRELYIKAGSAEEPMCERWVKAAIMQNLPDGIIKNNATALKDAANTEEIQHIVNTYMYDYRTGLPRGQTNATLFLAENGDADARADEDTNKQDVVQKEVDSTTKAEDKSEEDKGVNGTFKGKGKGKGNGKSGYGQCWHCGKYGHPRRECPDLAGSEANTLAALKGKGKGKGKGKYGKYNFEGYGKSGGKYNGYRSPGKAVGKGNINYYGADNEYWNAWGTETDYWGEPEQEDWNGYYIGNVTMMLERDNKKNGEWTTVEKGKDNGIQRRAKTHSTGERSDEYKTRLCNTFQALYNEEDDDEDDEIDEVDDNDENDEADDNVTSGIIELGPKAKRAKNNKRQRQREKERRRGGHATEKVNVQAAVKDLYLRLEKELCEAVKDVNASEDIPAEDWDGLEMTVAATTNTYHNYNTTTTTTTTTPHKPPQHQHGSSDSPRVHRPSRRIQFCPWVQSSQAPCNCVESSGLLAETDSHMFLQESDGAEGWEVMSPSEESPPTNIASRSKSVPSPTRGLAHPRTRPAGSEYRHVDGGGASSKSHPVIPRALISDPGSTVLVRGEPDAQRCGEAVSATQTPSTVAALCAGKKLLGWSPSAKEPGQRGYRRIREAGCRSSTHSYSSAGRLTVRGLEAKNADPRPGRLRGRIVSVASRSVRPTSGCKLPPGSHQLSSSICINNRVSSPATAQRETPDGYYAYIKEDQDKEDMADDMVTAGYSEWRQKRQMKRMSGEKLGTKRVRIQVGEELCEDMPSKGPSPAHQLVGSGLGPVEIVNSTPPRAVSCRGGTPRVDLDTLIFGGSTKQLLPALRPWQIRALEGKSGNSPEKHGHTLSFGRPKSENDQFGDARVKMDMPEHGLQTSQPPGQLTLGHGGLQTQQNGGEQEFPMLKKKQNIQTYQENSDVERPNFNESAETRTKFELGRRTHSVPTSVKSHLRDESIEVQLSVTSHSRVGKAKTERERSSENTSRDAKESKILEDNFDEVRDEHVVLNHDVRPKMSTRKAMDVGDTESHEGNCYNRILSDFDKIRLCRNHQSKMEQVPTASGNRRKLDTPKDHHEEIRESHVVSNHVVGLEVLKEDLIETGKRDEERIRERDCKRCTTTEATGEGEHIRVGSRDAIGREMEDHVVCATGQGANVESKDKTREFLWFATRVVCNWLTQHLDQDGSLYWNVDDYDGEESYLEKNIMIPIEYERDPETEPYQYQRLRQKLIEIETWQRNEGFGYPSTRVTTEEEKAEMVSMIKERIQETRDNEYEQVMRENKQSMSDGSWKPRGQPYSIKAWQQREDAQLACFTKGRNKRAPIGQRNNDEESEEEGDGMVCNMTGENWGQLPFPIIIDSGACISVIPTSWCSHVPIEETSESRAGEFFRAANGEKIYNEGRKTISLMTKEGVKRDMKFTACEVSKALGSVSQICRAGHTVMFNPAWHEDGSYIQHVETGERMWLSEHNGLYVLDTRIAPSNQQTSVRSNQGFARQANP